MSLQLEDVVDCLQVLYPEFDLVVLFDHSQGHARKRNQALSAQHMSKSYGGAQPLIRDTTIMAEEGYLGHSIIDVLCSQRLRAMVPVSRATSHATT